MPLLWRGLLRVAGGGCVPEKSVRDVIVSVFDEVSHVEYTIDDGVDSVIHGVAHSISDVFKEIGAVLRFRRVFLGLDDARFRLLLFHPLRFAFFRFARRHLSLCLLLGVSLLRLLRGNLLSSLLLFNHPALVLANQLFLFFLQALFTITRRLHLSSFKLGPFALALLHLANAFTFHPLRLAHLGQGALFALSRLFHSRALCALDLLDAFALERLRSLHGATFTFDHCATLRLDLRRSRLLLLQTSHLRDSLASLRASRLDHLSKLLRRFVSHRLPPGQPSLSHGFSKHRRRRRHGRLGRVRRRLLFRRRLGRFLRLGRIFLHARPLRLKLRLFFRDALLRRQLGVDAFVVHLGHLDAHHRIKSTLLFRIIFRLSRRFLLLLRHHRRTLLHARLFLSHRRRRRRRRRASSSPTASRLSRPLVARRLGVRAPS